MLYFILFGLGMDYLLLGYPLIATVLMLLSILLQVYRVYRSVEIKDVVLWMMISYLFYLLTEKAGLNQGIVSLASILLYSCFIVLLKKHFQIMSMKQLETLNRFFQSINVIALLFIGIGLLIPNSFISLQLYQFGRLSMLALISYIFLPSILLYYFYFGCKKLLKMLNYKNV